MNRTFYFNRNGGKVFLANIKPRNLSRGGIIRYERGDYINRDYDNEDTIKSMLEIGSLVIPKPIMKRGLLNDYPHPEHFTQPTIKNSKKLTPVIVMEGELIVPKKYASNVKEFLRKKGVTLPIEQNFI